MNISKSEKAQLLMTSLLDQEFSQKIIKTMNGLLSSSAFDFNGLPCWLVKAVGGTTGLVQHLVS